jgi:hypothetical protein
MLDCRAVAKKATDTKSQRRQPKNQKPCATAKNLFPMEHFAQHGVEPLHGQKYCSRTTPCRRRNVSLSNLFPWAAGGMSPSLISSHGTSLSYLFSLLIFVRAARGGTPWHPASMQHSTQGGGPRRAGPRRAGPRLSKPSPSSSVSSRAASSKPSSSSLPAGWQPPSALATASFGAPPATARR